MPLWIILIAILSLVSLPTKALAATTHLEPATSVPLIITTSLGNITIEVYPDKAPLSANYFLKLVDTGAYTNSIFYRALRADNSPKYEIQPGRILDVEDGAGVIQGGVGHRSQDLPTVPYESAHATGLKDTHGALLFARPPHGESNSEFFIRIGAAPDFDDPSILTNAGIRYAVFGQVIDGMDIVQKIQQQATNSLVDDAVVITLAMGQLKTFTEEQKALFVADYLREPVKILSIKRQPNHHD